MTGLDTFSTDGEDPRTNVSRPFDDDGYLGYDPCLLSQRFDSFSNFIEDSKDLQIEHEEPQNQSPPLPIYGFPSHQQPEFPDFSPISNSNGYKKKFLRIRALGFEQEREHSSMFAKLLSERERKRALSFTLTHGREQKEMREKQGGKGRV
ncbi:hypothetical protein AMTRI_Chr12g236740 [Amborella trichopoda]